MQFFTILAFVTAALAKPASQAPRDTELLECSPPSYACKPDFSGWLVCNVDGFYLDGGSCAPEAWCEYINGLPYCIS
ncbi:hypothetical protein F4818DRAFT_453714 [Hypoxylon cercidicola]|nr:hypothetical protein F4818DRAFT_453714 [Hypoxylon cercidicola]